MASIFLTRIPFGTKPRNLRKAVGRAIRTVCVWLPTDSLPRFDVEIWNTKSACMGRISLGSASIVNLLLEHFRRHPLRVGGGMIATSLDRNDNAERLKYLTDRFLVPHPAPVSDYDSEEEESSQSDQINFSRLSCGVWRVDGSYAEAWAFEAHWSGQRPEMRIEHDNANLHIDLDHRKIQISLYDIVAYVVDGLPPGRLYVTLRALPTFLEDPAAAPSSSAPSFHDLIAGFEFMLGPKSKRKLLRVAGLSKEHEEVAPFCWVYTIEGSDMAACMRFFKRNSSRLGEPTRMRPNRNLGPSPFSSSRLEYLVAWFLKLDFPLAFQLEGLLYNRYILPEELCELKPDIDFLSNEHGGKALADAIKYLCPWIPYRDAFEGLDVSTRFDVAEIKKRLHNYFRASPALPLIRGNRERDLEVHSITITPSGIYYDGPHFDPGNRIIREYPGHENNYLRVRFADETQSRINFDRTIDVHTDILQKRFKRFLDHGIKVGGRKFDFLAFSNSALRQHSTWFVLSGFYVDGQLVTAESIRSSVGDLKAIRCAPRWAARLGQSFTTAARTLKVPVEAIENVPDAQRNGHCFSDGVGTLSAEVVRDITANPLKPLDKGPVVFQIRLGGAKGVLALDPRMEGYKIRLRPSQIKYRYPSDAKELSLEVAADCTSASHFYLNRPMVALLESLGISAKTFCTLQHEAVSSLEKALDNPLEAAQALRRYGLGQATKLGRILKGLDGPLMGLDKLNAMRRIPFLRHCVVAAITYALRAIKYHCRIFVPNSCTVMGIMDETETLEEGEIYVCLRSSKGKRKVVKGECLVARPPTMHPGDVQIAYAIGEVAENHPLRALHNCIVFSSKGKRPLQTMLAGGDLDGDLYNVSQYDPIMPRRTYESGAYPIVKPKDLQRDVEIADVVKFFLDYIETDQLGRIATMHLIQADRSPHGVCDDACLMLAELHSTAVDMAKTGIKPDLSRITKLVDTSSKPDFMQKEFRIEPDVPDFTLTQSKTQKQSKRRRYWRERDGFYRSEKALGQLFRRIDVSADIARWQSRLGLEEDSGSVSEWADPIKRALSRYIEDDEVDLWTTAIDAGHQDLLEEYYISLDAFARDFAPEARSEYLTEEEVFVGVVIGRGPFMQHNRPYDVMNSLRTGCRLLIKRVLEVVVVNDGKAADADDVWEGDVSASTQALSASDIAEKKGAKANMATNDVEWSMDDLDQIGDWADVVAGEDDPVADFSEEVPPTERFKRLAAFFVSAVNYQVAHPDRRSAPWIVMPELLNAMDELEQMKAPEKRKNKRKNVGLP